MSSLFAEHQIHNPAPADVRAFTSAMRNDLLVLASGVHQSIGQDRHPLKRPVVVDRLGQADSVRGTPAGVEGDGAEWVAVDAAK